MWSYSFFSRTSALCLLFIGIRPGCTANFVPHVKLIIVSDGRPSSRPERETTRAAWLHSIPHTWDASFIISAEKEADLAEEQAINGDLMFVAAPDDYTGLSRKTLAAIQAIAKCGHYGWVVKTDHDVHLNVPAMHVWLEEVQRTGLGKSNIGVASLITANAAAVRTLHDKNADSRLPLSSLPPYPSGVLYVLPNTSIQAIAALSEPMLTLNEDQSVGIWLAQVNNATRTPVAYVHNTGAQPWHSCCEEQLVVHGLSAEERRAMGENRNTSAFCAPIEQAARCCGNCIGCPGQQNTSANWYVCGNAAAHFPGAISIAELFNDSPAAYLNPPSLNRVWNLAEDLYTEHRSRGHCLRHPTRIVADENVVNIKSDGPIPWVRFDFELGQHEPHGACDNGNIELGTFLIISVEVTPFRPKYRSEYWVLDAVATLSDRYFAAATLDLLLSDYLGPPNTLSRLRMGKLHEFFGMTVDVVGPKAKILSSHAPFGRDATYTHHEVIFINASLSDVTNVSFTFVGVSPLDLVRVIGTPQILMLELPEMAWPAQATWTRHAEEQNVRPGYDWREWYMPRFLAQLETILQLIR